MRHKAGVLLPVLATLVSLVSPAVAQSPAGASQPVPPAETVVVIGAAPGIVTSPAAAATTVPRLHIERRTPEHLGQLLETMPGVGVVSEGHAAVPAIRGLARGRTLLLIDGARVSAERRVGPAATFLDPAIVEAVDVARGAGAVAYGSDALGGVIAVRTREVAPGAAWSARATLQGGVGVPLRRGGVTLGGRLAGGGILVSAHQRDADDYTGPGGQPVLNSGWRDSGALLSYARPAGGGLLTGRYQADIASDIERPRSNSATVRILQPYERSHRVTAAWQRTAADGQGGLRLTAFHGWTALRTDQQTLDATGRPRSIERADVTARDLQWRLSANRALAGLRVEGGLDVHGRYGLDAADGQLTPGEGGLADAALTLSVDGARRLSTGVFLQASAPVSSRVTLAAGLRGDEVRSSNRGGAFGAHATRHGVLTGFAASTVRLSDGLSATAQVSRGFRDPTLSERYFRGPSGRGIVVGNPDLRPEHSVQLDLAVRQRLPFGQLAVYGYDYRLTDLVERYETQPDRFAFRNRGHARLRGVELETTIVVPTGMTVELSGQLARGSSEGGQPLDDVAPRTLSAMLRQDVAGRGFVEARIAAIAADGQPGPTEVRTPGGTVVDLGAGVRLRRAVQLRAQVRNALDVAIYASPDPRWVYAPGRSASLILMLGR